MNIVELLGQVPAILKTPGQTIVSLTDKTDQSGIPVIAGDLFIVPNIAYSKSSMVDKESWAELTTSIQKRWLQFGGTQSQYEVAVPDTARFVRIWMTSEESENWVDHLHPQVEGRMTECVPSNWLEGLEDGDRLIISTDKYVFVLTMNQGKYRYRSHGDFVKVLETVNKDYVRTT